MRTSPFSLSALLSRQGLLFDLAVFLANLLLVEPLTDLVRRTEGFHPLFGALMLAAFVSYTVGAYLKRGPLQARWAAQGRPTPGGGAVGLFYLLVLMLYGLLAAMLIFSNITLGAWPEEPEVVRVAAGLCMLALAVLPTAFTIRAVLPPAAGRLPQPPWYVELLADLALYAAVVVIMAWWEGVFVETLVGVGQESLFAGLVLVVLVTVPFAMFYLAPRLLLLVEDYRSRWTWLSILLVMVPLAGRIIFG